MYRAFNMGVGLIIGCAADDADRVAAMLQAAGETRVHRIGRVQQLRLDREPRPDHFLRDVGKHFPSTTCSPRSR